MSNASPCLSGKDQGDCRSTHAEFFSDRRVALAGTLGDCFHVGLRKDRLWISIAKSGAVLCGAISHIDRLIAHKEMTRIHAPRVIALVQDQTGRPTAKGKFPRNSGGRFNLPPPLNLAVPTTA